MGLEGVRIAARRDKKGPKKERFTALLHHITPQLLRQSCYALPKDAAAGVDAVTWPDYEEGLAERVQTLHRQIHAGGYRATPSRRVYIPKADGTQRALGIASLEDKVVQQTVVTVLNMIYEEDFPWILVWVSARAQPAQRAGRAHGWDQKPTRELDTRCRHSGVL